MPRKTRTTRRAAESPAVPPVDPQWYKDAVIYQLHVRSFFDSDKNGIGDFAGLAQKLDYLQELGVTALWLLPFYPSPLRDDGYDISDYTSIHPSYGGLRDFKAFVREAHARGLRVITELVINHTSDQHPWFQRARTARPDRPNAISTSGATRRKSTPKRGSSSKTSKARTGRGIPWPKRTTGTGSMRISPT